MWRAISRVCEHAEEKYDVGIFYNKEIKDKNSPDINDDPVGAYSLPSTRYSDGRLLLLLLLLLFLLMLSHDTTVHSQRNIAAVLRVIIIINNKLIWHQMCSLLHTADTIITTIVNRIVRLQTLAVGAAQAATV